jgi:hypothetical protein
MSWAAIIAEFFAGLFGGIKAAKTAKAAGELEAGKREVKAVDADVAEIRHELAEYPKPAPVSAPAPATPAPASSPASAPLTPVPASHITD